jgi:glycosyltransferase involved in cell wall biosynthesis
MPEHLSERIFIIIPAYNEGAMLVATLQPFLQQPYAVVVVDDGSTDDTWARLADLPVYALRHSINLGQGAALQTGTTFALQQGATIVVHFDADGQHQLEDIETLIAPLRADEADVVLGSRFLHKTTSAQVPHLRRVMLRGAVLVNWLMTGLWLTDAHNGLRALNRHAASQIDLLENRYTHASEILLQIRRHRLRYTERPTHIVYTSYSLAKGQNPWNALHILIDLMIRKLL